MFESPLRDDACGFFGTYAKITFPVWRSFMVAEGLWHPQLGIWWWIVWMNGRFGRVNAIELGVGATEEHAFYTANRDHLDRRPLFTLRPKANIEGVHIARTAFAESFLSFSS
ncbi:hypothetical protein AB0K60_17120 [Thermopolyspora sp. NPDC052614]|uniref:hypothetical protein n=1 Tax=Thermopolyspora sp. NPDC052614 TaxID=3155682 RepID=UPI003430FD59